MTDRREELLASSPVSRRAVWTRTRFAGRDVCLLCGTIGAEFDAWQRRLTVTSAADGYLAQMIGLELVEAVMDEVENEARSSLGPGETLSPRRSPGYGDLPLELNRDIVRELDAARRIGVTVTESLMLAPSKSVTAICEVKGRQS